jgi:hypothetical protein
MWRGVVKGSRKGSLRETCFEYKISRNRGRKSKEMLGASWEYDQ